MNESFVYDSRCSACKSPFGAVPCGQAVDFHVRPLLSEGFTHCALSVFSEFSGLRDEYEMLPAAPEGDRACFGLTYLAPAEPELVWYSFRFWRDDGTGCILDRTGYRSSGDPDLWQLTVWDDTHLTPDWFGEGIAYQIFPDRFCRLSTPDPTSLVGNRWVHESWSDTPEWRPDADGEVRSRDFFGGSLQGILSKLDYLQSLGITVIYLCPIFESASNHRYNTANYRSIDPMLGTEEDFQTLCVQAEHRGIRILLDGVFNHTGSNSIYFNAEGFYPSPGAAQSKDSPYYDWYSFHPWPTKYDAWWGIRTLPAVNEESASYREFIVDGEDSVIRHWLRLGASGWRLDVADELPDDFIVRIRTAVEQTKPDGLLLGEVWEDGSNKIAYSHRRKYLLGTETHGLMNYPFRTAVLAWLLGGDAAAFQNAMETIRENYPTPAFYSAMNFLGTHDTPRVLTLLSGVSLPDTKERRAEFRLSPQQRTLGLERLRLAALLLYIFPGCPTVYYGDEAGMEGCEDPFNRGTYPWGSEASSLIDWYALLGRLRMEHSALRGSDIRYRYASGPGLVFSRTAGGETVLAALNAGDAPFKCDLPWENGTVRDIFSERRFYPMDRRLSVIVPPRSGFLLI